MDKFVKIGGLESVSSSPYAYKWRSYCATVYKCRDTRTNETVVIKEVPDDDDFLCTPAKVTMESCYLKEELAHANVVRLLEKISGYHAVYLVFEHFDLSLRSLIKHHTLESNEIKKILHKILLGVAHCHSKGIMHRHLEAKYVLLDLDNDEVKLSEFGEAMGVGLPFKRYNRLFDVTPGYKAPELLLNHHYYTKACDMWSVGCIFGEMVLQDRVFRAGCNALEEILAISSLLGMPDNETCPVLAGLWKNMPPFVYKGPKSLESKFNGLDPAGVDLISKMLCLDPSNRISAEAALDHVYFDGPCTQRSIPGSCLLQ